MTLDGTWYNELKSEMVLSVSGSSLTGTYKSSVGAEGIYSLTGSFDIAPLCQDVQSLGFIVTWNDNQTHNYHSTTTWSGRYLNGQTESLVMFWLLSMEEQSSDQWKGTLIGEDIFTRTPPSDEIIQRRLKRGGFPHPIPLNSCQRGRE